jgi:hypothetical protein
MKKTILLAFISLFSTLTFASEVHSNVKIKEVTQFDNYVLVNVDEGMQICNFAGTKGCSKVLEDYILSSTISTKVVDQLIDAKENQTSVNLITEGDEQGYSKIISVESATN